MAGIFSFTCSCCGKLHKGSPSFGFKRPDPWLAQPDNIKEKGKESDDLCYYEDKQGMNYFARVILEIPIHGIETPFLWGVWVSLSQQSYDHYCETWDNPDKDHAYFGWLCSKLPYYESTYSLATNVFHNTLGKRPLIHLQESDHELYQDFIKGMSIEKAQKIAELCMHGN